MKPSFALIENYIYMYHTDTFIILPVYPESITDMNQANFSTSTPLSRSAPIFSFSNAGPRQVSFNFNLHRDLMQQVNYGVSNAIVDVDDDYIDTLVKQIQACALPNYSAVSKMVDPPMIALRLGDDIFIKGVVIGGPSITYGGALIKNLKKPNGNPRYSQIGITLTIYEVDPYGAETVMQMGSFRGLTTSLEDRLYGRTVAR